jgi:hypothetical protein
MGEVSNWVDLHPQRQGAWPDSLQGRLFDESVEEAVSMAAVLPTTQAQNAGIAGQSAISKLNR